MTDKLMKILDLLLATFILSAIALMLACLFIVSASLWRECKRASLPAKQCIVGTGGQGNEYGKTAVEGGPGSVPSFIPDKKLPQDILKVIGGIDASEKKEEASLNQGYAMRVIQSQEKGGEELLRVQQDGGIFLKGKKIAHDKELADALKGFAKR